MSIFKTLMLLVMVAALGFGQGASEGKKAPSESGAVSLYGAGGWSFGLPAVRAAVAVGSASAMSPEKKMLAAPSVGVGVRAWKFLVPFVELTAYDTGKATVSVGNYSSQVQADTLSVIGGMRFVAARSTLRAYAELGGGSLYQKMKGNFYSSGTSVSATAAASAGAVMFGGGVQRFIGRHWGSDIGFDVFTLSQQMTSGGRNFARVKLGLFYQTKSSVE